MEDINSTLGGISTERYPDIKKALDEYNFNTEDLYKKLVDIVDTKLRLREVQSAINEECRKASMREILRNLANLI